jgi:hypothetical protein
MLPRFEIVTFEGTLHEHHHEKTGEYLEVVHNFIDKTENR